MPEILEVKPLPLDKLSIGKAQARVRHTAAGVDELAQSIATVGLLEPIVVCPAEKPGYYEIITGQRRFMAHQQLNRETILCAILPERITGIEAKTLSATENIVRSDLNRLDLIDVCTALFKHYASISGVVEATGLPRNDVSKYVKYERLIPELKELVDSQQVKLNTALRAQDAASVSGSTNTAEAVEFAREMEGMSGVGMTSVVKTRKKDPSLSADETIERAKSGGQVSQVLVVMSTTAHSSLKAYASDENTTLAEAAHELIQDGLSRKGYSVDAE